MPRKAGNSAKAERDQLRERMRGYGCTVTQIAAEMARRFNLRPRVAWRNALGWPQWKLAQQYNTLHPGARLSDNRVSEYEAWPHGGSPPSLRYLARLAVTFAHGCTPAHLVDADDLEQLTPADRCLLTAGHPSPAISRCAGLAGPFPGAPGQAGHRASGRPARQRTGGARRPCDVGGGDGFAAPRRPRPAADDLPGVTDGV
ncbi:MAG: hypothetical protein ACRDT0_09020 [Pseudonocardiaceae bacterium]